MTTERASSIGLVLFLVLASVACGNVSPLDPKADGGSGGATTSGTGGTSGMTGSGGHGGSRIAQKHRATADSCVHDRSASTCQFDPPTYPSSTCATDADCAAGTNGRCQASSRLAICTCSYDTCFSDADCSTGGPCACRTATANLGTAPSSANICLPGNCRVDADCGPGGSCSPTYDFSCGAYSGVIGYHCHTASDGCLDDADCAMGDCRYNPATGAWACAVGACAG
jgi:hypothetical protein